MKFCKHIGCRNEVDPAYNMDYCRKCSPESYKTIKGFVDSHEVSPTPVVETSSGGDNDYWLIPVPSPKRLEPYTAEAEDIIEALEMTFQEGEAFKAIIRKCKLRLGDGKPGDTELRNSEKVAHFGQRMVAMDLRKLEHSQCDHLTH